DDARERSVEVAQDPRVRWILVQRVESVAHCRLSVIQLAAVVVLPAPAPPATGASLPIKTTTLASFGSPTAGGGGLGNGCTAAGARPSFAAICCASAW